MMSGVRMQMASRSGDMRRLLDVCAAAVDLVVQEASEPQPEQAKSMCTDSCNRSDSLFVVLAGSCLWLMCMQHICTSDLSISAELLLAVCSGEGETSEPAMAPVPAPKVVGIAPMFRAISQLQGGQSQYTTMLQMLCIAWR